MDINKLSIVIFNSNLLFIVEFGPANIHYSPHSTQSPFIKLNITCIKTVSTQINQSINQSINHDNSVLLLSMTFNTLFKLAVIVFAVVNIIILKTK